jgi:hypothetical protein
VKIPVSAESVYAGIKRTRDSGKNHDEQKTTEKEVITTSNKEKKAVAPASKTAPVAAKTGDKKSSGKRK